MCLLGKSFGDLGIYPNEDESPVKEKLCKKIESEKAYSELQGQEGWAKYERIMGWSGSLMIKGT